MKILLENKRAGQLSLDLPTEWGDPIRLVIPQGGSMDIGQLMTVEEANRNEELRRLYSLGYIGISVALDAMDIEPLIAAEEGGLSGALSTALPWIKWSSASRVNIVAHPAFPGSAGSTARPDEGQVHAEGL